MVRAPDRVLLTGQIAQVVCEGGAFAIAAGAGGGFDGGSGAELSTPQWWRPLAAGSAQVEAARAASNGARSKTNRL